VFLPPYQAQLLSICILHQEVHRFDDQSPDPSHWMSFSFLCVANNLTLVPSLAAPVRGLRFLGKHRRWSYSMHINHSYCFLRFQPQRFTGYGVKIPLLDCISIQSWDSKARMNVFDAPSLVLIHNSCQYLSSSSYIFSISSAAARINIGCAVSADLYAFTLRDVFLSHRSL